jgi:phosphate uptake regulator
MILDFFRKGDTSMDQIDARVSAMINDARHSFDLATAAVLSGAASEQMREEVEKTDLRINEAEQQLRQELVVHVAVQGGSDIGTVLGITLLIKKIERIGDQAKNILDLTDEGVSLVDAPDLEGFLADRTLISDMFVETAALLSDPDEVKVADFRVRADKLRHHCEDKVREYMHSDDPGRYAVPRAILYRYWKRIVANLLGVVTTAVEPVQNIDYVDDGATDITDD